MKDKRSKGGGREVGYTRLVYEVEYPGSDIHTCVNQTNRWDLDIHDALEMVIGVLVAGGYSERLVRGAMRDVEMVTSDGEEE